MHIPDFIASDGWLDNFKKRHGITFKTVQGEAVAVNLQSLLDWKQQVLHPLLRKFSADDVFNLDEIGLFWQLLPNKTLNFRREQCTGGKKSKQRIILLVGANMSGTEKFPLLAIGKSKRPVPSRTKRLSSNTSKLEGVDDGKTFRRYVTCVGRTSRSAGTKTYCSVSITSVATLPSSSWITSNWSSSHSTRQPILNQWIRNS